MSSRKERFREDAQYIIDKVIDVHPQVLWKLHEGDFERLKMHFSNEVATCDGKESFWKAAKRFMTGIGDAHTDMSPIDADNNQAPLVLEWIAGQAVVDEVMPCKKTDLQFVERGDVILFVDSKEIGSHIYDELSITPANFFDHGLCSVMESLLNFPSTKPSVKLTLSKADATICTYEIPLFSSSDSPMRDWQVSRNRKRAKSVITWRLLNDVGAGLLDYNQCMDRSFPQFVKNAEQIGLQAEDIPAMDEVCKALFSAMSQAKCSHLIVDLRDNSGGASIIGHNLFKYLTRKPLKTYGSSTKVSASAQEFIRQNQRMYPKGYQKSLKDFLSAPVGSWLKSEGGLLHYPYVSGLRNDAEFPLFEGDVIVLANVGTFSSGEWLAVEMKDNGLATFVGEPTGGGGTVPGDTLYFQTPNLGLAFTVSYKLFTRPDRSAETFATVLPNYYVKPTLSDYREGTDTVIEWVKGYIRRRLNERGNC